MTEKVKKDKLIKALLIVSIVVLSLLSIYVLKLLAGQAMTNISNAFKSVFIPFSIAFFLSFIINPLSRLIEKKIHLNRNLSIILSIFLALIIITGLFVIVIVNLFTQMTSIFDSLITLLDANWITSIIDSVSSFLESYLSSQELTNLISELTTNGLSMDKVFDVFGQLLSFVSNLTSSIFQAIMILILTPVFSFYLIKEKSYIFNGIKNIFPKKIQPHLEALGLRTESSVKNYLKGQGIMIGLIAIYFMVTLSILSFFVPNFSIQMAILFGLLMGLFNIIPYLGAWIGLAIPIVFLFTMHLEVLQTNETKIIYIVAIIILLVLQIVEQAVESSIVSPLILGNKVQIHPLLVLSSLIFFGGVFGFVGVLLAVPLAATLKSSLEYFKSLGQEEKTKTKVKA
ncbi:MAG: AI-2E family transporter [Acholeplasmataceae bacterium]|nr:AI-2E family transporter [Acholeplasmataceae bacterium]